MKDKLEIKSVLLFLLVVVLLSFAGWTGYSAYSIHHPAQRDLLLISTDEGEQGTHHLYYNKNTRLTYDVYSVKGVRTVKLHKDKDGNLVKFSGTITNEIDE